MIQQFEADYNSVDDFLRKDLRSDKQVSFAQLVKEYSRRHLGWRDSELLRTIAEIRNVIVHGKTEPYRYVAVPTPPIVEQLRNCRERLINPARAIPRFQRTVKVVSTHDSLATVLKIIHDRAYSQFPVYKEERFRGLITENGITRWLARRIAEGLSIVKLEEVSVEQVLQNEEKRRNYAFVQRDMRLDDVRSLFAEQVLLEAVLITANGKETEKLLGIATRWDLLHSASSPV